jgi:uncharacterized membrane protein
MAADLRLRATPLAAWSATVFAVAGLAISAYLTVEHYTASSLLACPETGAVNCAKVTTSRWAQFAGAPVALLGTLYFLAMVVVLAPPVSRLRWAGRIQLAASATGVVMVLYLVWIELFRVNAICLWCTGVHICTVAMFASVLWRLAVAEQPSQRLDQ